MNGQIYAQPLAVGDSVIVATETDRVYSLNAETGAVIAKLSTEANFTIHMKWTRANGAKGGKG